MASERALYLESYPDARFFDFRYVITTAPYPEGRVVQVCLTKWGAMWKIRRLQKHHKMDSPPQSIERIV